MVAPAFPGIKGKAPAGTSWAPSPPCTGPHRLLSCPQEVVNTFGWTWAVSLPLLSLLWPGVVFGSDPGVKGVSAECDRSFTATAQWRAGNGCCGVRKGGAPVSFSHPQGAHCWTHLFLESWLKWKAKFPQLKTAFAALKHMWLHVFRRSHQALLQRLVQLP